MEDEYFIECTTNPFTHKLKFKTEFELGNWKMYTTKHLNRFQKLMYHICFGVTVRDANKEKEE